MCVYEATRHLPTQDESENCSGCIVVFLYTLSVCKCARMCVCEAAGNR